MPEDQANPKGQLQGIEAESIRSLHSHCIAGGVYPRQTATLGAGWFLNTGARGQVQHEV